MMDGLCFAIAEMAMKAGSAVLVGSPCSGTTAIPGSEPREYYRSIRWDDIVLMVVLALAVAAILAVRVALT